MKQKQVAPVRVACEAFIVAVTRPAPLIVGEKKADEALVEFVGDLLQIHHSPGTSRTLHLKGVAVEMMIAFERFDEQVIEREPNWASPIGVAAEKAAHRFARLVADPIFASAGC